MQQQTAWASYDTRCYTDDDGRSSSSKVYRQVCVCVPHGGIIIVGWIWGCVGERSICYLFLIDQVFNYGPTLTKGVSRPPAGACVVV